MHFRIAKNGYFTDEDVYHQPDSVSKFIKPGDVVTMAAGCRHTAVAGENGLQLIEVQLGDEIDAADKQKYEL